MATPPEIDETYLEERARAQAEKILQSMNDRLGRPPLPGLRRWGAPPVHSDNAYDPHRW